MSRISRLVDLILRLAPTPFRTRYRHDYLATVQDRLEAVAGRGAGAVVGLALREVVGAAGAVASLWWMYGRSGSPGAGLSRGGVTTMDGLRQDARYALRSILRNPGYAAAAVTVLALGIGANAAIFSAVNAFLFRPLPFADEERLVTIYETNPEFGWVDATAAPANALDWRDQVEAFEDVAMYADYGTEDVTIHLGEEPLLADGSEVTGNFFSVLGVEPALGRTFRDDETWLPGPPVTVISHALWSRVFGSDPDIVGRRVPLGSAAEETEIIGVMPEGFTFPFDRTDLWTTYRWEPEYRDQVWFRRAHLARAVARLEEGVTLEEADAQLQAVVQRLQGDYPATNAVMGAGMTPIRDFLIRGIRTPLEVLAGAVGLLLLLACANIANLMIVRAGDRVREVAVRHALGANRSRVVRHFMAESLLIALVGGGLGLALGWIGITAMSTLTQLGIEGATTLALDGRVVAFTFAIALASGVVFGTAPALRTLSRDLQATLRDGGRGQTAGRGMIGSSRTLVAVEIALALVLVMGAGLMLRSAWLLRQVDPGFHLDGVLAVQFTVPESRYPNRDQVLSFWDRFSEGLEARPGIERAGTVGNLPLAGRSWSSQFQAEGWPPDRVGLDIVHRRADRGYFEALGIPLVRGRHFGPQDGPDDPLVVVINETFAERFFPGEDPIGQKIAYDRAATPESIWYEIVGIVGDQAQAGLRDAPDPEVFENRSQDWWREVWVVMRTTGDPVSAMPAVRDALAELDPGIPIAQVRVMRDVWADSMSRERFLVTLLVVFGVAALLLATVGVYGVTAQAAKRRTHEIGIRLALGASAPQVVRLMVGKGVGVVVVGLGAGVGISLLAARGLETLVFGIEATDPLTLSAVAILLGGVALFASWLPARAATRVDPVDSLRAD